MKLIIRYSVQYQLIVIFMITFFSGMAQIDPTDAPIISNDNPLTETASKLSIQLEESDIRVNKVELAANLLTVQNNTDNEVTYYVELSLPDKWKSFGLQRYFIANPGETMVVPLRVLPLSLKGNTQFFIGVNVFEENGDALASNYFYISSYKVVNWDVSVTPGKKNYFKNGENTSSFDLNVVNQGNYPQDIVMHFKGQRNGLKIKNKGGEEIKSLNYDYSLKSLEDTTFSYDIETCGETRNVKMVSMQNHRPNMVNDAKNYVLYVNTSEALSSGKNLQKKSTKIEFTKLANEKKANQFSGPIVPLIVETNFQNITSNNPMMMLNLRGFQIMDDGSNLVYFGQLSFTSNFYSERYINNSTWYGGYFNKDYTAEIGNINGGVMGIQNNGKGAKASYRVIRDHWVGAFYTRRPNFLNNPTSESFGAFYKYLGDGKLTGSAAISQSNDFLRKRNATIFNGTVSYNLAKNHFVSASGAFSNTTFENAQQVLQTKQGFILNANYGGAFVGGKLRTSVNGNYQSPTFGLFYNERKAMNTRARYTFNDKSSLLFNSTINENIYPLNRITNENLVTSFMMFNNLAYNRITKMGSVQPYTYAQSNDIRGKRLNSFGLGTRFNTYILDKNVLWSSNFFGGYNKGFFLTDLPLFFNFGINSILRIKTFSGMVSYTYGSNSPDALLNEISSGLTPSLLRVTGNYQYMFKNRSLVLNNSLNYSYRNQSRNSVFNYIPEIFYFTNTGWRFSLNANLSYAYGKSRSQISALGTETTVLEERVSSNSNLRLGASIRKEFGIPIPFAKQRNFTKTFIAFYDLNGNSIKDKDEPSLENVIVKVANHELITNKEGVARLIYANGGTFAYTIYSLDELNGWFPNVEDSLTIVSQGNEFVPFVKGIKLYGSIVVDRERLSIDAEKALDLTNVKLTATGDDNHHTLTDFKGNFEFYLPNGSYTISINEAILGNQFKLAKNDISVYLSQGIEGVFITFYIIEKKRKVSRKVFGKPLIDPSIEDNTDADKKEMLEDAVLPEDDKKIDLEDTPPVDPLIDSDVNSDEEADADSDNNSIPKDEQDIDSEEIPERTVNPTSLKLPIESLINMDNIDPNKVGYVIDLGSFEKSVPINVLNKLIKMGYAGGQSETGKLRFVSKKYKTELEAEQFRNEAMEAGFGDPPPSILGDYDGIEISAEKAGELYEKGLQQQNQ